MSKKKKTARSGFAVFMLIYALVLCTAVGLGLRFLWSYMEAYEAAKSNIAVERYEQSQMALDFDAQLQDYALSHATALQTGSDVLSFLKEQLGDVSLRLKKEPNADPSLPPVYSIQLNRQEIGRLYTKVVPLSYGLQGIEVDRADWAYEENLSSEYQIIAPKEAGLTVNGIELNEETCTVTSAEHSVGDLTKGFDPVYDTLYSFSYYGTPEPQLAQDQRQSYELSQDEEKHFTVFAHCDAQTISAVQPIAEQFVRDYILFTSNAGSYGIARNHMVPDSPLYIRVSGSVDGMQWVAGITSTISDLTVDHFVPFGSGVICDAHYKLTDLAGSVMDYNMRILFVQYLGMWKVFNIQMY